MTKVVLDTNIIVSSAKSPHGKPKQIMTLFADSEIDLYYSLEILDEYREVLSRARLKIPEEIQTEYLDIIKAHGILIEPSISSNPPFDDESDRIFYDTAKEVGAVLITGNMKHYPQENFIMTPSDYVNLWEQSDSSQATTPQNKKINANL